MNESICTIIVNSCDKYEEAWLPFFSFFYKYWNSCPYPIVLNTETKKFKFENLDVRVINSNEKSWGGRLYQALEQINTSYVICMLEDFFLQKEVDSKEIERCIERMESDDSIGAFYFNRIGGFTTPSLDYSRYFEFVPYSDNPPYYFNCQAAIWRKKILMDVVKVCETPWQFELEGYKRAGDLVKDIRFFCLKQACYDKIRDDDVFSYLLRRSTGYGIWGGKWLWNNKKLFKQNGIDCKCETLAQMSHWEYLFNHFKSIIAKKIGF